MMSLKYFIKFKPMGNHSYVTPSLTNKDSLGWNSVFVLKSPAKYNIATKKEMDCLPGTAISILGIPYVLFLNYVEHEKTVYFGARNINAIGYNLFLEKKTNVNLEDFYSILANMDSKEAIHNYLESLDPSKIVFKNF